ncbi:MAG: hypothetical protein ABFD91_17485 [Anaerohalosphaeraceae bacterium]
MQKLIMSVPFLFIVFPLMILMCSGSYEEIVRIFLMSIMAPVASLAFFWLAINPKSEIMKKRGKPKMLSRKAKIAEVITRLFICVLAMVFLLFLVFPIERGAYRYLINKESQTITGKITRTRMIWGMWFLYQAVFVENDIGEKHEYFFLYSTKGILKPNNDYTLKILPYSEYIISFEKKSDDAGTRSLLETGEK